MEAKTMNIDLTERESHTWARTRMRLMSQRLSWIFKITFFYFLTFMMISSSLPTAIATAKDTHHTFSDSFGYLDLELNNELVELDAYNFKSVILEYPTVFVYFNFENNRRNAAILQTLELVAQLLSNKNVLVARVTDKQFAEMLDIPTSGSFRAYHKGHVFPFYGYPAADVIMHFILKIREPVVKEISGKETKIAFDKVNVPTFVGFFEEENEDYSVFEETALSYLPYIQFYATFDETVAKHLKLDDRRTYRYRRPLEEKSFLVEERLSTVEDVQRVVETYKAGPLHKFSLHNIYHPWNREEKDEEFLAFADPKSPKGKTFHKVLKKFIKKEMQASDFDVKIIWIDPSEYPMMIPIWEHKYEISLDEPHFGHITDSEVPRRKKVRWLEIQRLMEFEEKHKKHSVMKKWIHNEEDPYTPEEPEPEEADGEDTEEPNEDVKEDQEDTEQAEEKKCGEENECSMQDTEGNTKGESEENEDESVETEEEEEEEETETEEELQEAEEEYSIDEWMDYFDQLEEMEILKDLEEKKVKEDRKDCSKESKPVLKKNPVVTESQVANENLAKSAQKQQEQSGMDDKREEAVRKESEKKISTKAELEETLNEINKLVDQLTNGHNEDNTSHEEQPVDEQDDLSTLEEEGDENKTEKTEEAAEESEEEEETLEEELDTEENLRMENEALRKENLELKEELKEDEDEEEDDDDDDDDDDNDDITSQKRNVKTGNIMYKDQENYPTYNVDLDVLVDSFDGGGGQDEWDQYFDELEHKKSTEDKPGDKILKECEKKKKMKKKKEKAKESDHYMFKEEDYPLYNVDLDVLVDSFETDGGDEYTRYFDRLEAEEDRKLDEKMKRKAHAQRTGRGSGGGGSSFFAAGMPMKDDKIRVKQFLEREKQRRNQMKQKFDKETIKTYLKGKSNDKKKEIPKETTDKENDDNNNDGNGHNENSQGPMKEEERVDDNKEQTVVEDGNPEKGQETTTLKNPKNQEDSSIFQETLLKLVKDIEELLSFNGHTNGIVQNGAPNQAVPNSDESKEKTSKNKGNDGEKSSSILDVESLNLLPKDIDLTDPESVVNTIKHTTNAVNKIMQDFADSLTARLLDGRTGRDGDDGDNDDDDDDHWEAKEEWEEKLRKLCKKGRLSSADCNQIIHGRSMEHVYNFQKSKSPKVPKFKPSPPSRPEIPEAEPEPADSSPEVPEPEPGESIPESESADSGKEVREPKVAQEEIFENTDVGDKKKQVQETVEISNEEMQNTQEPTKKADAAQEESDRKIDENIPDNQAERIQDEIIASETGTNFDESLFYDEETIHRKEEEQFFYRFDDWNQPASSSPIVDDALDYRSQKYFDELEGIDRMVTNGYIIDDNQSPTKDHDKENVDKDHPKESDIPENGDKLKKENKYNKKKEKKEKSCDCEKERKKLKGKRDKHYDEEEWEESGKYVEKYKSSDSSEPCYCKWKLLP